MVLVVRPSGPAAATGNRATLITGMCLDRPWEKTVSDQRRDEALQRVVLLCGRDDEALQCAVTSLWDEAYEAGRLEALDELQDRFCVCMK